MKTSLIILAAGKGTRMNSELPKVLHPLAGRPLVDHVIDLALGIARPHDVVVVVGHQADAVTKVVRERGVGEILQEPQLGTGDALRVALEGLQKRPTDRILVLSGDVPLLRPETLSRLTGAIGHGRAAALLSAELDEPGAYGRVVRDADGMVREVVEARDADSDQLAIREVNAGVYAFDREPLNGALAGLGTDNVQSEYYLTDVAAALREEGMGVTAARLEDPEEMLGVNTMVDLARVGQALNRRVVNALMDAGVSVRDPETTWIDPRAVVGREVVIEPGVVVRGYCQIGEGDR